MDITLSARSHLRAPNTPIARTSIGCNASGAALERFLHSLTTHHARNTADIAELIAQTTQLAHTCADIDATTAWGLSCSH
ncbi:hypothetical protein [Corynebacterium rouxii]|uniref:Uncharacterized protein n=1 Tax=Corynebacterium rouxii TaxID=2719119 RepID=A0ABU3PPW4_9CORY|nr:hypothetical protein [Corynebacterium rouxii]MDT9409630.1 hypothetical protein [Corynebacterium rouxii]MDT9411864.1 hypothetical protein [Corynebacterium rouxii]